MTKLKLSVLSIITLLLSVSFFVSCSNENENFDADNSKIKNFENKIILYNKNNYQLNALSNSKNNYNSKGIEFYNTLQEIKSLVWESNKSKKEYQEIQSELRIIINSKIENNIEFNQVEKLLLESYMKKFSIINGVELSIAYENFAIQNYKDQNEIKNFLKFVTQVKYLSFTIKPEINLAGKTYRQWEACTNSCMQDRYESYNIVDWVGAVATGLVGDVGWNYAACSYGCL
jgi:hypothetical protein